MSLSHPRQRTRVQAWACILVALSVLLPVQGQAQNSENKSSTLVKAVQNRPHHLTHELGFGFSVLPSDHFNQYVGINASYAFYFENEALGWEVIHFSYLGNQSTGLAEKLNSAYGAQPETSDIVKWQATSNILYTPLFMKHLVKGKTVMWGDLTLVAGAGQARLDRDGYQLVVDLGGAVRFFSGENTIYKIDLRQYFYMVNSVKPNLGITFGVAYNFGGYKK